MEKPTLDRGWIMPDSQAEFSEYPYNHVQQTESGHSLEFDDTPNYERIRLQHRIGNYTEIQSNGDELHKIVGDEFEVVVKNRHVLIKGYCTVTIQGDSVLNVEGDVYQKVKGNVKQKIDGDVDIVADGEINLSSKSDINLTAGGAAGQVNLSAPFGFHINSDLTVGGAIFASGSINSNENLNAAGQAFALQGIQTVGGINSGFVSPTPPIPGIMTSTISMNTIIVNSQILNDVHGPVVMMRSIFTSHIHGRSGPPNRGQL
ncbi:MAG: hypothetical protein ACO239_00445 [Sediminibacterium sp.]